MLSNGGQEMSGMRVNHQGQAQQGGPRSQDDATVGYFFQRPQTDVTQQYSNKRWAVGDDSVIEQVRGVTNVSDLEREFQHMGFPDSRPEISHQKKFWDDKAAGDAGKAMFPPPAPNLWTARDDSWPAGTHPQGQPQVQQAHPLANPMHMLQRRPGSFPGSDPASVLSPRSSETGALGVNMAEYVLGGSPVGKDLENRLPGIKRFVVPGGDADAAKAAGGLKISEKVPSPFEGEIKDGDKDSIQPNGIIQNGIEDDKFRSGGSRQNSPTEGDIVIVPQPSILQEPVKLSGPRPEDLLEAANQQSVLSHGGGVLQLDGPQFEPVGIDPFQVDYSSQIVPPMDSPNFSLDYSQQQRQPQQQQQQPIAVLTQQQYALAAQQQQLGPAVLPQYYGVQTPWGIYPAAGLLQQGGQTTPQPGVPQQGQVIRGQAPARPLTPSQDALGTPTGMQQQALSAGTPAQYQILAPAYYDQNGQLVMGNGRGIGTPVRLVSPAPILVNAAGQQGTALGVLTPQGQQLLAMPASSTPQNTPLAGTDVGLPTQRRDSLTGSLDAYKQRQLTQYYGALGTGSTSPHAGPMGLMPAAHAAAQSLTPPPSLNASTNSLSLGGGYTGGWTVAWGGGDSLSRSLQKDDGLGTGGRLYSAAPGAEAKFNRIAGTGSSLFGTSLFNHSASLSKEVTGRSRLLEDFRNNRIPNLQLKDLVNHVVEFSQDQHGSRFIQQKLERATPSEKAMVFGEILSAAYSLMTDVFGNYVIQKFFEFGTSEQKQTLAQRVRGHVLPLALQMYGCRVIQKALESIPQDMQVEIVKELDGHVLKCVKDQNGNHVVQKCIECIEPQHMQFIVDSFKGQVFSLSTHPYGCRVIQRILEHCTPDQTTPILDELHQQAERLVQVQNDQYGNYVIQHVLEHGKADDKSRIVAELRGKVLVLSQHKFASNVVEKCVTHGSRAEKAMLIEEVCTMNDGALYTMMKDQFANYVVQKMIDVSEPPQRKMLMHKIRPHVSTLRKFTYGKHILAKLEKFYMKSNADLGPIGMPPNGTTLP